jgi:glycopeptide antibiotics resistance protein
MTDIPFFPYPFLVGLLIVALAGFLCRKRGWGYVAGLTMLGLYTLALISAMFFPIRIPEGWPASWKWDEIISTLDRNLNLIPFKFGNLFSYAALGRISYRMVFWQTAGNILITIPFGLGIGFLTKVRGWWILLIALGTGLTLEGVQLSILLIGLVNLHVIDINDMLLNTLGVLAGYGLFLSLSRVFLKSKILHSELNR